MSSSETLERWCAQPAWDTRSLEEFAAEGGRPVCPPNRSELEPSALVAFFAWAWGLPWLLVQLLRPRRDDRGRFLELPEGLEVETGHLRRSWIDDSTLGPDQVLRLNVGRSSSAGGGWPT